MWEILPPIAFVTFYPKAIVMFRAKKESNMPKSCVYTTLIGQYEALNEQPAAQTSSLPFICLTDDPDLRSESWQIRLVEPTFAMDPIRSQRDLKLRPHLHLPDFEQSLYIDNSVMLKSPPDAWLEEALSGAALALPTHSYRDSVLDEFIAVEQAGLEDPARLFEQLNHYLLTDPDMLEDRPFWTAIMFRDHCDDQACRFAENWFAHVMRYARRDQLSACHAFRHVGLKPRRLEIDNYSSAMHSWPHITHRDHLRGMRNNRQSQAPATFRLREAEMALAEARRALEESAVRSAQSEARHVARYTSLRKRSILRLPRWAVEQGFG